MTLTAELHLEHVGLLRAGSDETWELAIIRMPQWIVGEPRPPYRPLLSVCMSAETGLAAMGEIQPPEAAQDRMALEALEGLARTAGIRSRPARVAVRDARLAETVGPALAELGIELEVAAKLPLVDHFDSEMRRGLADDLPGYLDGDGVTLDRVRAFGEAAAQFHSAALWNHLSDLDLVCVESKAPHAGLRRFVVLGAAGITYGLGFHPSSGDHQRIVRGSPSGAFADGQARWMLTFGPAHEMPVRDADLWEDHGLPAADEQAYPLLLCALGPDRVARADASTLAFFEGLLRGLAATTEDEIDGGRWSKEVTTFEGARSIELVMPSLLEPPSPQRRRASAFPPDRRFVERTTLDLHRMLSEREFSSLDEVNRLLAATGGEVPHPEPATPAERAQELFYQALEAEGRLRVKLAREALRVWPDHADSIVVLAEEMPDLGRKLELYRRATEAAERTLGPARFEEDAGHFWGVVDTRPYMRARLGLADCLWHSGQRDAALDHWQELLRLNPRDNLGVRDMLLPRLLELGKDDRAAEVLAAFEGDRSALPAYARALLDYRRGDEAAAERSLRAAVRSNPHVVKHLVAGSRPPDELPAYCSPGGEDEAVLVAVALREPWARTAGAIERLREFRRSAKKARETKRRKR